MLGFLLVDGLSIVLGASLLGFLPMQWVAAGSGVIFILFGIIGFFSRDKEDIKIRKASKLPILTSFSLITLNELGDKTQIAAIALAAETSAMPVLLGVMLAFTILTATAVTIGGRLLSRAPLKWLRTAMTVLFVTLGIISILSTFIDLPVF
jgi:putative Ca2+/H+ antiporter (TMEM165/GDT1 family)